ncbi:MAG: PLP-dependent aminotransferase family protein [Kofleriaceae bacterium]
MDLHLSLTRSRNLAEDIFVQMKQAILDGRLRAGDPLPSSRDLARQYAVGRNTVTRAYERLMAEGFLRGEVGAGTFVAADAAAVSRRAPRSSALRPRKIWAAFVGEAVERRSAEYDFRIGAPDPGLFPWDEWRGLVAHELRGRRSVPGYPGPEGDPRLREAIARHIGISRAVRAGGDDVLVCSGAQQAFDLIARVLVEPGACVAVEDPGYPLFRHVLVSHGARVVPVKVDAEGIDVAALPDDARLVYVTPSHQFPLGTRMSLGRRVALLRWCERRNAAIVEDDYDAEFRVEGQSVESLQSLDRAGRVLYVGTFSKVLLPTLRIGFVVAPATLAPSLRAAKRLTDSHGPLELQRALATLLTEGLFARHIRRLRRVYGARRDALLTAVERVLADVVTVLPSSAGLHVSVLCRDPGVDAAAWATRAFREGVAVQALDAYYLTSPRPGFALGYGLIPVEKVADGIARLAKAARPSRRVTNGAGVQDRRLK